MSRRSGFIEFVTAKINARNSPSLQMTGRSEPWVTRPCSEKCQIDYYEFSAMDVNSLLLRY